MKKVLMLSLAVMMVASSAMADSFGIFTDQLGNTENCTLVPPAFSPFSVYVVHHTAAGTTGSQFKAVNSSGYTLSGAVLGGFLAIGDLFTDLSLAYGGCIQGVGGSIAVASVSGFGFPVPGQTCGVLEIVPAPGQPYAIAVSCEFTAIPSTTGKMVFNSNETCPCIEPNATEQSTWGKVKSLYR